MSKRLKVKTALLIVICIVGLAAMGIWISTAQTSETISIYEADMKAEMEELPKLLEQTRSEESEYVKTFDANYQSIGATVAFMAQNDAGYAATDEKMSEFCEMFGVANMIITDKQGEVLAKAKTVKNDLTDSKFDELRKVFQTDSPSDAVSTTDDDNTANDMRYYSAKIDDETMVVVAQNPASFDDFLEETSSEEAALKNLKVGQTGYVFSIDASSKEIEYHPDSTLVGKNVNDLGLTDEELTDGNIAWMKAKTKTFYGEVEKIGNKIYVAAIPESDISNARSITLGVILFVFAAVLLVIVAYGLFVLRDEERRGVADEAVAEVSHLRVNKKIARKGLVLSVVGFVAIVAIAFYMQTLFALSSQSMSNSASVSQIATTIKASEDHEKSLRERYNNEFLTKAKTAAYILQANPALKNKSDIAKLAKAIDVQYVDVFNNSGEMTVTNSPYTNYTLSSDPSDSSYEFRKLLQGVDYVLQDAREDEISGDLRQYIGVSLKDSDGNADGFVQINVRPERLAALLESTKIDKILDGVKLGELGFAFAVDKNTNEIAYYPDSRVQGKLATEVGMTDAQLKGDFNDYLTINGKTYLAASAEEGSYYVYVATLEGELMAVRGTLTMATSVIAFICLVLIFLILVFENKKRDVAYTKADAESGRIFDTTMPDGSVVRTETLPSRFLLKPLGWHDKTPEQKVALIVKTIVGVAVLAVCVMVLFKDSLFDSSSIFSYILNAKWERGLNIFALSASIMFACTAITAALVVKRLLLFLAETLGSQGATICRLGGSVIKYATIIGTVYYCLALLGVDTTTLLASAGILSIAISLGAKDMVADILSGMFIIFEDEFRVGDVIEVDGYSGTVVEIGLRTTKVMDGSQNMKVIRNSNIDDVINRTKELTFVSIVVGIEYNESLERVEAILADELPKFKKKFSAIKVGPFYRGVVELADNSVNICIVAQCREQDRAQLVRDLNREIKLLFDHYDIGIPFPQVVVNEPMEKKEASFYETQKAEKFRDEQRVASQDIEDGSSN